MAREYDEKHTVDMAAEPTWGAQIKGPVAIRTHRKGDCAGEHCCIHNPSDHPLSGAPLNWRADRSLMERICEHGIGHPDPDDIEFKRITRGDEYASAEGVHGCDGCCT